MKRGFRFSSFGVFLLFVFVIAFVFNSEPSRAEDSAPVIPGTAPVGAATSLASAPLPSTVVSVAGQNRADEPASRTDDNDRSKNVAPENNPQGSLDEAMEFVQAAHEYWVQGDEEKALAALDQAYGLIVQIKAGDDPKMVQQKEDLRFTISKRILEIYASRVRSVKGSHKAIPLTINKYVEREINCFTHEERHFFLEAYRRSGKYRAEIVKALKEEGLPEELSWLPLIESGFKVNALSRSRALGLWQFIPSTGYKFGLRRNGWLDERMDPAKSTAAAIAYFKELHDMFGDWATVLAAYNCGEGNVLRAISRQKKEYLDNFWDLYERLPAETARYYPRFLAVLAILKDPQRYNMSLDEPDLPRQFDVVTVRKQLSLAAIAQKLKVPFADLAALNPELRHRITPPSAYALKVPSGTGPLLEASLDTMRPWSGTITTYAFHRVRRGENLALLALQYRTSVNAIIRTNNMRRKVLRVGQRLRIPLQETSGRAFRLSRN